MIWQLQRLYGTKRKSEHIGSVNTACFMKRMPLFPINLIISLLKITEV